MKVENEFKILQDTKIFQFILRIYISFMKIFFQLCDFFDRERLNPWFTPSMLFIELKFIIYSHFCYKRNPLKRRTCKEINGK